MCVCISMGLESDTLAMLLRWTFLILTTCRAALLLTVDDLYERERTAFKVVAKGCSVVFADGVEKSIHHAHLLQNLHSDKALRPDPSIWVSMVVGVVFTMSALARREILDDISASVLDDDDIFDYDCHKKKQGEAYLLRELLASVYSHLTLIPPNYEFCDRSLSVILAS